MKLVKAILLITVMGSFSAAFADEDPGACLARKDGKAHADTKEKTSVKRTAEVFQDPSKSTGSANTSA